MAAAEKEASEERTAAIPTDLFVQVIVRLHSLPERPCGSAICHCIERISDRQLPDEMLSIVSWYAMNDPDPAFDVWQQKVNDAAYYGGDPYHHGINSVRGQALEQFPPSCGMTNAGRDYRNYFQLWNRWSMIPPSPSAAVQSKCCVR